MAHKANTTEEAGLSLLALLLGALAGYVDLTQAEVQAPAFVLLTSAFLLGALHPRGLLRWALLLGLSVPAAHLAGALAGVRAPYAVQVLPLISIPVIFAFLAALAGALARGVMDAAQGRRAAHES